MLWFREYTEVGVLMSALQAHGSADELGESVYATVQDVSERTEKLDVHASLKSTEVMDMVPLLYDVEEQVGVPLDDDEVWYLHGVVDWYSREVHTDWVVSGVLDRLSEAVSAVDSPPY